MPPVAEMIRIAHEGGVGTLHQVAIREHREPFYPKVGDWNRFTANTGGTLVEKCCHYFNLMDFILKEKPHARVRVRRPAREPPRREATAARRPTSSTAPSSSSSTRAARAPRSTCACSPRTRSTTSMS